MNQINISKAISLIVAISFLQLSVIAQDKQGSMNQQPNARDSMKSISIHQEVDFNATPQRLYEALLDTKQFCEFTVLSGEFSANSAKIDRTVGGAFSLFEGHIIGRNIELLPNQRIVQAWRVVDWPEGVYSIVKFELKPQGSGTHLIFDHTGFPEKLRDQLASGWKKHYWDLLTKYLH
ncbi:MAG TPA: SRPBCC family protein [Puia sp.]|jgi:activator of HSP90 ATPase|nr:SRPBCC family protein [Puia sp.]